jgi:hypothetical protein
MCILLAISGAPCYPLHINPKRCSSLIETCRRPVRAMCCALLCRALSDKDRKWVAAIAAKLGECLQ